MVVIDELYLLQTLQRLVQINSVLPNEEEIAVFIAEALQQIGLEPEWHEVAPGRPNVYAKAVLGPGDRFLLFSGHPDTVDVAGGWETDPFALTAANGRLYGLGVYNMKAGLACMLAALKALLDDSRWHGRLGQLGFAATVDQEGYSRGARALLQTTYANCDAMLHGEHFYGDSEADYLPNAGTGKLLYRLHVKGKAAHGFRPHLGVNAVDEASRIVLALDQLQRQYHPQFGRGTVCTLKIDGGYKEYAMVVPEQCELIITRLTVPGETAATAVQDMRDLITKLDLQATVTIEIVEPSFDAYYLDANSAIMAPFEQSYQNIIGKPPTFAGHSGITDANVFVAEGGIPTIAFGPKGGRHHMPGEYVEKATLLPVARVYAETAVRFLQAVF